MIEPEIKFINEPMLTFAHGQKALDPRDGLMLYGPFDSKRITGQTSIGIIGPSDLRKKMIAYLKQIHNNVTSNTDPKKHPYFPGIESVFGIFVNFNNIPELDVTQNSINEALKQTNSNLRVHELVNLYINKLCEYSKEQEIPVGLWLVVIPESVYTYARPKSKIKKTDDTISYKPSKDFLDNSTLFLFQDIQEEAEQVRYAYQFEVDFHNQLKARLLEKAIVTQIIRESKISTEGFTERQLQQEELIKTAKAWNISSAIYYKLGGLPWKMGDVRDGVCYVGLVYKKTNENNNNACCAAQMFLDSGDGMVFRGNVGPWWNPKTKEFHLRTKDAKEIIEQSIQSYYKKFDKYPKEIFIHAKTYFNDDEWAGFEKATDGKCKIIGVRIRDELAFKLYRHYQYCVPRGMILQYDDNRAFLWTKGFIPRFETQIGLETPNPLDIQITRGDADIEVVCKDILSLTKLNYNACIYGDGLPVTLKFADSIGDILTAGKDIRSGVLPFKYYI